MDIQLFHETYQYELLHAIAIGGKPVRITSSTKHCNTNCCTGLCTVMNTSFPHIPRKFATGTHSTWRKMCPVLIFVFSAKQCNMSWGTGLHICPVLTFISSTKPATESSIQDMHEDVSVLFISSTK